MLCSFVWFVDIVHGSLCVQTIMLDKEYTIKKHREESKSQLGRITSEYGCVSCVVVLQNHLQGGEETTSEIKQPISDCQAHRRLARVVHVRLRNVLDQRDPHLDVAEGGHPEQPGDFASKY